MTGLSHHEANAIEQIDAAAMLAEVEAWAAINSGTGNLAGLARVASAIGDALATLPGDLRLVDPAPVDSIAADGGRVDITRGQHLHLAVRPQAPVRLLLTGHMDTVFAADHPFQSCHWISDGVLGGPGTADMKGGIAVMIAGLNALEASPMAARIGYDVLINSDEETGSHASAALIAELARGKAAALTYEPAALPDGTLAGARPGSGNFSIIITGRAAHAGRNPGDGHNAVLAAADLALRLAAGRSAGLSVNPARIDGGGPNNVVPDHAVLRVNLRPRTPADEAAARALIDDSVATISAAHDVSCHVHGSFNRPAKPVDAGAARLFDIVTAAGRDLGLTINRIDTGGVCDGNNIAACGVPVVDTMGVRGGNIHSSDEYMIVDSLRERAALSAVTIMRIAAAGTI